MLNYVSNPTIFKILWILCLNSNKHLRSYIIALPYIKDLVCSSCNWNDSQTLCETWSITRKEFVARAIIDKLCLPLD